MSNKIINSVSEILLQKGRRNANDFILALSSDRTCSSITIKAHKVMINVSLKMEMPASKIAVKLLLPECDLIVL